MRIELTKAWSRRPIPAEDLALILRIHYKEFIEIMAGVKEPSESCKNALAQLFDEPVGKLFPQNGDSC